MAVTVSAHRKVVPFHKSNPIFGALGEFRADELAFLSRMRADYGDIVRYKFLHQTITQVNHPDLIQQVLVEKADLIRKSDLDHSIFEQSLGNGLLISEGEFHKRQRKMAQPAFHHKRIENYGAVTVDFTQRMLNQWRDGQTFNIHEVMTRLTLLVVSKVLYDADVSEQADGIGEAVSAINELSQDFYRIGFVPPLWLPLPRHRKMRAAVHALDITMKPIIESRRKLIAQGEDRGDLLSMLLMAQDEENGAGMSDQQVLDEAVTMMAAGHETTSNALTWAWYLLAANPDKAAKLREELDQVLGQPDGSRRLPTVSDLPNLKYTDWVVKEAMRIYPPAWILNGRVPQEDIEIGGYPIPKGTGIFISPYAMHHDPRYFDQPDVFLPERWVNDFEKRLPRYAYFPFGGGPRVCIGNSFAMMEARLIVAAIASQFDLSLLPSQTVEMLPLVTLRVKGELNMRVTQRAPVV